MKPIWKGILVAGIQVAMIASIGAKLRYDRSTRPRVWVRLRPWDPDLPIRERYLALQLEMPAEGFPSEPKTATSFYSGYSLAKAKLQIENDELVAVPTEDGNASLVNIFQENGCSMARVNEPVNFYIPENTKNPLAPRRGQAAQEAWVEVTLPRRGPPRPIRLGIKTDGSIVPLDAKCDSLHCFGASDCRRAIYCLQTCREREQIRREIPRGETWLRASPQPRSHPGPSSGAAAASP